MKPRTKADYRYYIEHIRAIWGNRDPQKIETHHIYELHRADADHWRQANYLVQVMVVLLNHARLIGFLKKEHSNPAKGIPLFKQQGEGWEPWPDDVRAEFEAIAGPRARLIYELCIGIRQRIGDVLRMRRDHIKDDQITVMQGNTDMGLTILMTNRLLAYLGQVRNTGLTIFADANGAPAVYRTIAQEMRVVKAKMKHPEAKRYVTHGLRKNATINLYQAGNRDELVKAVTGHSSTEMLKNYGGAVRQISFAREAQEARNRAEQNKDRT